MRASNNNPKPVYANQPEPPTSTGTWWSFTTVIASPAAFSKTAPINGAIDQLINPTLQWQPSTRATSYLYCYDSVINSSCDGSWISTTATTIIISPALNYDTQYEWQVKAVNANPVTTEANDGTWWTFTTAVTPPAAFNKTSPVNGATNQAFDLLLMWQASTYATSYEYCYDATVNGACDDSWRLTTATEVLITGLPYQTQHEWQVRAVNAYPVPTDANGGWWTFTTYPAPPLDFNKTGPTDGAIDVQINPTLSWETSTGADGYQYCIDSTINSICDSEVWISNATTSVDLSGLTNSTLYEWQVRAINDNPNPTYADTGIWHIFTTVVVPPAGFTKSSPVDGTINVPVNMTLTWSASNGATGYEYCFDDLLDSSCPGGWTSISATNAAIILPDYSTEYEWQVRAVNANPVSTDANGGTWWHFTSIEAPAGAFGKISPILGASNQPLSLTLQWEESSSAISYAYCYDSTIDALCNGDWTSTSATSADISGLSNDTLYEWQVQAVSNNPEPTFADGGTWWTFSTVEEQPGTFGKISPTDGAIGRPVSLMLEWGDSLRADKYAYCYDETINDSCDNSWTQTELTYAILPSLTYATEYEWQVRAINDNPLATEADAGAWWTFTVMEDPLIFVKHNPGDGMTRFPLNFNLTWRAMSGADYYQYCLEPDANDTCDSGWSEPIYGTSVEINLTAPDDYSTEFHWQAIYHIGGSDYEANAGDWWTFTTVYTPPQAFGKISPADAATAQSISLTLDWEDSNGATRYRYCVDSSINSGCDVSWKIVTASTAVISGLSYYTEYEWQVRAENVNPIRTYADDNTWWTFKTVIAPPATFVKLAPVNDATNQSTNRTLSWEASSRADGYWYCYDATINNTCTGSWSYVDKTITSVSISGMSNSTIYEWQVKAVNANPIPTYANSNTWWTFTTVLSPPGIFGKINPPTAAIDQAVTLTLSWGTSSTATSYQYCYDSSPNGECNGNWIATGTTSAQITGLTYLTNYEWQVRALNINPEPTLGDTGTWFTFTTVIASPGAFTKTSPANSGTNLPINLTLAWGSSVRADSYQYCIDSNIDSTCEGNDWQAPSLPNSTDLTGLVNDTEYEWQVRAVNANLINSYADSDTWWTFTTVVASPSAFSKIGPVIGSQNLPINDLTLTWAASTGATGYNYCYDTTINSACNGSWTATSSMEASLNGLINDSLYEWQVQAVNANPLYTDANSGMWWTFRVIPDHWNVYLPLLFGKNLLAPVVSYTVDPSTGIYTLTWDAVPSATNYYIWQSTTADFQIDPSYQSGGATYIDLPGLNPSHYYFYVVATYGEISSSPSNIVDFNALYELEANDSGATANGPLLPDLIYYGRPDDDKDFFKFYVDSDPARMIITLDNLLPAWNGQLQLYQTDTSPENLITWDWAAPYQLDCTPSSCTPNNLGKTLTAGWYYIFVATLPEDIDSSYFYHLTISITY